MATDKTGYVSVGARIEDKVMPDRVIFSLGFGGRFDTKEACLDDYNADRAKVAAALAPFGLDDELTCRRYTCYAQTTRKRAIIVGYDYYAYGTVAAPVDSIDCAAVWTALNTCGSRADMNIRFELSDERAAEDVLIARAVERARGNAQALAAAAVMRRRSLRPRGLSWAASSISRITAGRGIMARYTALPWALPMGHPEALGKRCWIRNPSRLSAPWTWSGGWSSGRVGRASSFHY